MYKCETISYGEDGLLEVSGSYAPTETDVATKGQLTVMQNWGLMGTDGQFDASIFRVSENQ